jgi:hypothetical protein
MMKKIMLSAIMMIMVAQFANAQEFGLSFSYFLPKNGDFSTPISPFSIRGLGFDINRFLAFETGASLYRMSGLGMKDLPFESNHSLVGPNFTIFVPAELVIQLKGPGIEFDIKGGGFFFYGFDQKINYGNMDRAISQHYGLSPVNSDFHFKNSPGFGYHAGAELTFNITQQVGLSIETNYLVGQSNFPLTGSFSGFNPFTDQIETKTTQDLDADFSAAKIDFTGLEFSIGLIFSSGGGKPSGPKKPTRRRR